MTPSTPVTTDEADRKVAIRPAFAAVFIIVGWLVVIGLTALALTRYRVSGAPAAETEQAVEYLGTIRDRLAEW